MLEIERVVEKRGRWFTLVTSLILKNAVFFQKTPRTAEKEAKNATKTSNQRFLKVGKRSTLIQDDNYERGETKQENRENIANALL